MLRSSCVSSRRAGILILTMVFMVANYDYGDDDADDYDYDDTPAMTVRSRDLSIAAIPRPGVPPLTPDNHIEHTEDDYDKISNADADLARQLKS